MPQQRGTFFVSHSFKDKTLTTHFGQLLRNISLNLLAPWFSSDTDHAGGIHPGDMWFERLKEKMHSSSAIIALITESSISSRWVFFESGFGAAIADKKLILVTHGIQIFLSHYPGGRLLELISQKVCVNFVRSF